MARQLFINGREVDLFNDKSIGLTLQVGSVLNPGNRAGNNTNKFDLPPTQNNNEIFETLQNINSNTNIPYQKNSAKYIQNGVELISNGFAVLESTSNGFKVAVYSGNTSFFDLIKGRNLNELDWADDCHDFDIPTIIASFTGNLHYIYGIVDWGDGVALLNNTILQNSNALIPIARMAAIIEKMGLFAGYEVKGSFLQYDQYNRLILTPNQFGFLADFIATVTGFADNVTGLGADVTVLSVCNSTGANDIINLPLVYNNIQGQLFDQINGRIFTPDNYYLGTFNLNAQGSFQGYIPTKLAHDLSTGNRDYKQCNINDTHASWISRRPGFTEQLVFVYDIEANGGNLVQVTPNAAGGTLGLLSMSEDNGGYLAWSVIIAGRTRVSIYNIATQVTTVIYDNVGGSGIVAKLKVYNGKVAWLDSQVTGGLFMYDIGTATTQTVSATGNDVGGIWDHNGDFLIWEEPSSNDINEYDYAADANTLIDNGGAFSGMSTLKVFGDYATYWDTSLDKFVSYKLSTQTNVTAKADAAGLTRNQARTLTKVAWTDQSGDLMVYDLLTDTLTNTAVANADSPGVNSEDRFISMNDDNIAYIANAQDDIDVYNITSTVVTNVDSSVENHFWVLIGKSNIISYHQVGNSDIIRTYDLTNAAFFADITNVVNMICFKKALNNDRMVFTNDMGLSSSPLDRVSIIEPIIDPIEVDLNLVIREDGVIVYSQTVQKLVAFSVNFNLIINTGVVYVKSGSNYEAELFIEADRDETIDYGLSYTLLTSSYSFSATKTMPYNAKLDMKNFYNTKMEKVLLDVLNQYSLTIQTNELTRQVFLNPLDDLIKNKSKAPDWSEKFNLTKPPNTKYKVGSYAQINNIIYAADEDVPVDTGKGTFLIDDTKLPQEKDIIKLTAAASIADLRVGNEHTPTIPLAAEPGGFFDGKKSRILLLDQFNKVVNFKNTQNSDTGQATLSIPFCYFEKDGKDDSLDFTHLIAENYTVILGMFDQVKFIEAGIRLTELDVLDIDFTIPIYIDIHTPLFHANGYFYVNKISNFKENVTTKVQLIRL